MKSQISQILCLSLSLFLSLSLSLSRSLHPLLPAGLPNDTPCLHSADVNKFLLVCQMSLMCSFLLLQQCSAYLVRLTWIVFEMRGKWPYRYYFMGCCLLHLFKIACNILVTFPSSFFPIHFASVNVVHPYRSIDSASLEKFPVLFYRIEQTSIWSITYRKQSATSVGEYYHHFQ